MGRPWAVVFPGVAVLVSRCRVVTSVEISPSRPTPDGLWVWGPPVLEGGMCRAGGEGVLGGGPCVVSVVMMVVRRVEVSAVVLGSSWWVVMGMGEVMEVMEVVVVVVEGAEVLVVRASV